LPAFTSTCVPGNDTDQLHRFRQQAIPFPVAEQHQGNAFKKQKILRIIMILYGVEFNRPMPAPQKAEISRLVLNAVSTGKAVHSKFAPSQTEPVFGSATRTSFKSLLQCLQSSVHTALVYHENYDYNSIVKAY
jgi:hypothetical protein